MDAVVHDGTRGDGHGISRRVPRSVNVVLVRIVAPGQTVLPPAQRVYISPGAGTRSRQLPRPKMRLVSLEPVVADAAIQHVQTPTGTRPTGRGELAIGPGEASLGSSATVGQRTVTDNGSG